MSSLALEGAYEATVFKYVNLRLHRKSMHLICMNKNITQNSSVGLLVCLSKQDLYAEGSQPV